MTVTRTPTRRVGPLGCIAAISACAATAALALALVFVYREPLALRATGFQPSGDTEQVFAGSTPVPTPVFMVMAPATPSSFTISAGGVQQQIAVVDGVQAALGQAADGQQLATLRVDEAEAARLCAQYSQVCGPVGDRGLRNARLDLRPSGAIVRGEVQLTEGFWQPLAVVLGVDASGRRLAVRGLDVNGTLYALPTNQIGDRVRAAEAEANRLLAQFVLQTQGSSYTIDAISITEEAITVVLR